MKQEYLIARVGMIEMIDHFGVKLQDWKLSKEYNPNTDEIWAWSNNGFTQLAGRRGYVLVRNGEILHETIKLTAMS